MDKFRTTVTNFLIRIAKWLSKHFWAIFVINVVSLFLMIGDIIVENCWFVPTPTSEVISNIHVFLFALFIFAFISRQAERN